MEAYSTYRNPASGPLLRGIVFILLLVSFAPSLYAQRPFQEFQGYEGTNPPLPADWEEPGEFVTGRLMYPSSVRMGRRGFSSSWETGGTSWAVDYPKGDRTFVSLLERFTTINTRSVEQAVNLDWDDDVYNWPFLIVGLAGYWQLTDSQVEKLREYLLRGGFLFADSFFDSNSWYGFSLGMERIFPDRPIVDLTGDHPVFNTVYEIPALAETQIPNMNSLMRGGGGYLGDGYVPHWRGILDDDGRLMVLIAFNNDVSDSWQWADDPRYPHEKINLGLRLAVNIAVYTLTH
jgi:hypothetical protein